jgi:hypothetical protein
MLVVDLQTKDVHDDCTDTKQGTQRGSRRYSHGPSWIIAAPSGGPPPSRTPQAQLADMDEKSDINATQHAEQEMALHGVESPSCTEDGAKRLSGIACVRPARGLTAMSS